MYYRFLPAIGCPLLALNSGRIRYRGVYMSSEDFLKDCPLASALAARMREARQDLAHRWLERIADRVAIEPNRIFPTDELLDHVPVLIDGIADYLENSANEISADMPVVGKAMELGELRHSQGFDAYEIMKEYEILGGILFSFLVRAVEEEVEPCDSGELLVCGQRLSRAVAIIQQTTVTQYLRLAQERVNEREGRLRAFNRSISHELKNHLGAIIGAVELLETLDLDDAKRKRFTRIVAKNAKEMRDTLQGLLDLSRLDTDARSQKHVKLPEAVQEVVRQLRDATLARNIQVEIRDMPSIEVNAAAVELCLTNYVSNAIKYADPSRERSWVEISGVMENDATSDTSEMVLRVRDNGLGVPAEARERLFERFFRAHEKSAAGIEGTGIGLSIVRETAEAMGGRAWAEFPDDGTVFAFSFPCRRERETTHI